MLSLDPLWEMLLPRDAEEPLDTVCPEEPRLIVPAPEREVDPTEERETLLAPVRDALLRTEDPAKEDLPAVAVGATLARGTCTEEERLAPMPLLPPVAPPRVVKLPSLRPMASALENPLGRRGPPYQ